MIKTHFTTAWKHLRKDKQFTLLNILGLSAGLTCTLLIYLWVQDEMSFDKIFEKDDQVYQLMEQRTTGGDPTLSDESSGALADLLPGKIPEIEYAAALAPPDWFQKFTLSAGEKNIKGTGQYAGKDYFNIFSFSVIDGDRNKLLTDKNSIVISDELALKLFGTTENLIGKAIRFQQEKDFFISGIFGKVSTHSSQQFDFVLSFEYFADNQQWVKNWNSTGPHNFVLVKKGTDIRAFNKKLGGIIETASQDSTRGAYAMKFSDNYLLNTFNHGSRVGGKSAYVKLFSLIAVFILVIACINFMNLSTAKASGRMKEVGIKKVVGAARKQLIFQFISESVLLTIFAMVLAVAAAWILLPQFNQLTGKQISLAPTLPLIIAFIIIAIVTGLLSGSYPAFYLSKFNPLSILKGKMISSSGEIVLRKGLVVFQFSLSVILIVSVLVIYQQIQFIQSTNPGYNKSNIVRFDSEGRIQGNEDKFIAELKRIPGVVNASFTFNNMVGRNFGTNGVDWDGKNPNTNIYFEGFGGGYDFIETMGMQIKEGRSFSNSYGDDLSKVILNEAAVATMQLKDPVGKNIRIFDRPRQVVGIVKDFHFESLHETVKPSYMTVIAPEKNPWYKIMTRIKSEQQQETIERIQSLYQSYNSGFPFSFAFLDEAYQKQYETEVRVSMLSKYFSALAILISCLGLFGLAAFTAQKRQKEIGIRKVIGASVNNITLMLSKEFLILVIIAAFIAIPVSWLLMNKWLEGFAYKINIGPLVFIITILSVLVVTIISVSFQAVKAAIANPVKSLRTE